MKNYFKTKDLTLASTLLLFGFSIDGIDPVDGKKKVFEFYFEETEALKKTISDFWGKRLKVEPREFKNARKELIDRIYNEK